MGHHPSLASFIPFMVCAPVPGMWVDARYTMVRFCVNNGVAQGGGEGERNIPTLEAGIPRCYAYNSKICGCEVGGGGCCKVYIFLLPLRFPLAVCLPAPLPFRSFHLYFGCLFCNVAGGFRRCGWVIYPAVPRSVPFLVYMLGTWVYGRAYYNSLTREWRRRREAISRHSA